MSHIGSSSGGGNPPGTLTLKYTLVQFADTPYTVKSDDEFLGVNSTGGAITIKFPDNPAIGRVYIIKDILGSAGTHNITLTTVSASDLIDNAVTFVMNTNWESVQLLYNGAKYLVF